MGGGVAALAKSNGMPSYTAYAENCVISNCTAARGGGAYNVTLVKCLVTANEALDLGSGTLGCHRYGSVIMGNTAPNYAVMWPYLLNGCTVADNTQTVSGGRQDLYATTQTCELYNSLIIGTAYGSREQGEISHCVFTDAGQYFTSDYTDGTCIYTNVAAVTYSVNGTNSISAAVCRDAGDYTRYDAVLCGDVDVVGMPRLMGAGLDIGAYEIDWEYKKPTRGFMVVFH